MRARVPFAVTVALLAIAGTTAAVAEAAPARPVPNGTAKPAPAAFVRTHGMVPHAVPHRATSAPTAETAPNRLDPQAAHQRTTKNGTVRVAVTGNPTAVSAAARRLGGRALVSVAGTSSVLVPKSRLAELAATPGVSAVTAAERPYSLEGAPNEGVAASGENVWHTGGQTGAGTTIAIVDEGFGATQAEYDAAVTAGELGATPQVVNEGCSDSSNVGTPYVDAHGLAVAEVAHDSAPDAQLVLYCVGDLVGMASAETAIEAAHIKIASSSVGWYGDSRGDGTGPTGSAAAIVAKARKAGILWIQAAGNDAATHWGRVMGDADHDHFLDINGVFNPAANIFEDDFMFVGPESGGVPGVGAVVVQWDQWPTTTSDVSLQLYGFQCTTDFAPNNGIDGCDAFQISTTPLTASHVAGTKPVVAIDTSDFANNSAFDQVWEVTVQSAGTLPTVRWDLNYLGDLDGPSANDCPAVDSQQNCIVPANGYSHSVGAPANSPYAFAVGAADVGADGTTAGAREFFSSQGPSIDGRVKPDITGWDGVTNQVAEVGGRFYGTSAAAPNVAGAAALVAGANPNLDAAQIQNFLEQRANSGAPNNPPTNTFGHGLLTLGAPSDVGPPPGSRYQPTGPTRILDTRTTTGGHKAPLGAGGTVQVTVPGLPADATAVAVNLTGTGPTANTYLSAYAGNMPFPNTVNLALPKVEVTASVFAIVGVKSGKITIRNSTGSVNVVVDEVGYFGTAAEPGLMTSFAAPSRVLDTRTTVGGHHAKIASGGTVTVTTGAPAGATAALVNLTTIGMLAGGRAGGGPSCASAWSTLYYSKYVRSNQAIVKLSPTGQFCLKVTGGTADFIVDVEGYLGASGSRYIALASPQRIVDTRTGTGGFAGGRASLPLAPGGAQVIYGSNLGDVPASATTLVTNLLEVSATATGYLGHYPGSSRPSGLKSVLSFTAGRTVSNAAFVGLPRGTAAPTTLNRFGLYNSAGTTNAVVDLSGYFLP
jgi:hypothetical protein